MTAAVLDNPIRDFATAVRAGLDDLPAEEVEDLTDGLEADLTEQAADAGTARELGDPLAYADELRAAAGLPARGKRRPKRMGLAENLRGLRADAARTIRSTAFGAGCLDLVLALRPVWWVFRGWALFQVVAVMFAPTRGNWNSISVMTWILLVPFVVVSVQWGRGRWLPWAWLPAFRTFVSIIAVIALPFLLATVLWTQTYSYGQSSPEPYVPPGLSLNGVQIGNIFAYDADGQPLTDVQLFDQDGNPVIAADDPHATSSWVRFDQGGTVGTALVPSDRATGDRGWNVFPLSQVEFGDEGQHAADPSTAIPATPPFAQVQPLAPSESLPSPTPAP
jgi:hypothetical protein